MRIPFDSSYGLIHLTAKISRRKDKRQNQRPGVNLALDTGATGTVISRKRLAEIGYDLNNS